MRYINTHILLIKGESACGILIYQLEGIGYIFVGLELEMFTDLLSTANTYHCFMCAQRLNDERKKSALY